MGSFCLLPNPFQQAQFDKSDFTAKKCTELPTYKLDGLPPLIAYPPQTRSTNWSDFLFKKKKIMFIHFFYINKKII